MVDFKKVFVCMILVFALFTVAGCGGVSEEEHEKTLTELKNTKAELAKATAKIADIEKSIKIPKIDTGMVEKLRLAQQKAGDLSAKVKSLTDENKTLTDNLDKLKALVAQLQDQLKSVTGKTGELPLGILNR